MIHVSYQNVSTTATGYPPNSDPLAPPAQSHLTNNMPIRRPIQINTSYDVRIRKQNFSSFSLLFSRPIFHFSPPDVCKVECSLSLPKFPHSIPKRISFVSDNRSVRRCGRCCRSARGVNSEVIDVITLWFVRRFVRARMYALIPFLVSRSTSRGSVHLGSNFLPRYLSLAKSRSRTRSPAFGLLYAPPGSRMAFSCLCCWLASCSKANIPFSSRRSMWV